MLQQPSSLPLPPPPPPPPPVQDGGGKYSTNVSYIARPVNKCRDEREHSKYHEKGFDVDMVLRFDPLCTNVHSNGYIRDRAAAVDGKTLSWAAANVVVRRQKNQCLKSKWFSIQDLLYHINQGTLRDPRPTSMSDQLVTRAQTAVVQLQQLVDPASRKFVPDAHRQYHLLVNQYKPDLAHDLDWWSYVFLTGPFSPRYAVTATAVGGSVATTDRAPEELYAHILQCMSVAFAALGVMCHRGVGMVDHASARTPLSHHLEHDETTLHVQRWCAEACVAATTIHARNGEPVPSSHQPGSSPHPTSEGDAWMGGGAPPNMHVHTGVCIAHALHRRWSWLRYRLPSTKMSVVSTTTHWTEQDHAMLHHRLRLETAHAGIVEGARRVSAWFATVHEGVAPTSPTTADAEPMPTALAPIVSVQVEGAPPPIVPDVLVPAELPDELPDELPAGNGLSADVPAHAAPAPTDVPSGSRRLGVFTIRVKKRRLNNKRRA